MTTTPPYLSPGLAAAARRIFAGGLGHTYTRIPVTVTPATVYAQRTVVPGSPDPVRRRCRYIPRTHLDLTDDGRLLTTEPPHTGGTLASVQTLTVLPDDPLAKEELVADVRDPAGRVLLVGPAVVESDLPHAGYGEATLRMVVLRGPTEERPL